MTEKNKELIQRMRSIAQASMGPDAVRVPPGIQALIDGADALEAALAQQPQGEAVANNEAYDLAYDKIDRFLRSNLDDDDYSEFSRALDSLFAAPAPASPAEGKNAVTEEMVSRFLGWRLPDDFAPDCGISFTPVRHYTGEIVSWPVGTNLLTAIQARQMLEHVLAAPSASDTMVYYGGGETPISFEDSASPAALTGDDHE